MKDTLVSLLFAFIKSEFIMVLLAACIPNHEAVFVCVFFIAKMSTYRGCPNKFPRKFQRSVPSSFSQSQKTAMLVLFQKQARGWNWKREETKTATTNSIRTGSPPPLSLAPPPPPQHHPQKKCGHNICEEQQTNKKGNS